MLEVNARRLKYICVSRLREQLINKGKTVKWLRKVLILLTNLFLGVLHECSAFYVNIYACLVNALMQVMEFTKENVASYIAMVGVLSVLAQVSIIFFLQ